MSTFPENTEVPPGRGETVLLVEDEDAARRITADALSRLGYRVISARDGQEALRKQRDLHRGFDLLLTDVVLPHVNGAELARRLRDRVPTLPVVFMSGHAVEALFGNQMAEAPPFLQKPFKLAELARELRRVLDARPREDAEPPTRKIDKL